MIAPHELKNKVFNRSVRGYNTEEVDEYIDFLISKYTELYKNNAETEQKLNSVKAKYDELSDDEESIRSVIMKAQKLGEAIIQNANKEADGIVSSVEERCDAVVEKAKEKLEAEKKALIDLRKLSDEFKHKLYEEYVSHLKMIKEMDSSELIQSESDLPTDEDIESAAKSISDTAAKRIHSAAQAAIDNEDSEVISTRE